MNKNIKKLAHLLKVLGSESALKIFLKLGKVKELCVSDISAHIKLSLSATSHQLRNLENAGLIGSFRMGRIICYSLKKDKLVQDLINCLKIKGRRK